MPDKCTLYIFTILFLTDSHTYCVSKCKCVKYTCTFLWLNKSVAVSVGGKRRKSDHWEGNEILVAGTLSLSKVCVLL